MVEVSLAARFDHLSAFDFSCILKRGWRSAKQIMEHLPSPHHQLGEADVSLHCHLTTKSNLLQAL